PTLRRLSRRRRNGGFQPARVAGSSATAAGPAPRFAVADTAALFPRIHSNINVFHAGPARLGAGMALAQEPLAGGPDESGDRRLLPAVQRQSLAAPPSRRADAAGVVRARARTRRRPVGAVALSELCFGWESGIVEQT